MTKRAASPALVLRVLGELAVERHGERLPLPPSKKARALLGYLIAEPREHTREQLCALFWDGPDDPRGALRWSLSRLRPLLEGHALLEGGRERVQLVPGTAGVDLHAARALCSGGLQAADEAALRAVAGSFRGELLEGLELPDAFRFQSWCTSQREDARRLHARVLAALLRALQPRPEEALPVARSLVELDPTDEAAHRSVMQLLAALGRPKEAVKQYDACRDILKATLGAQPSGETESVRRAIGIGAPQPPPARPGAIAAQAPRPTVATPLIAREAERAAAERALREPSSGLLLLVGEAGIGKSRLLGELAAQARAEGAQVLSARSYEAELHRPYGCFIDALRGAPLLALADQALALDLAALIPELSPGAPAGDRLRLTDAVAALLARGLAQGPLWLLLDDLHWLDEGSASLAHYLVRTLAQKGLRAVAASRAGELAENPAALRLVRALRHDGLCTEVPLSPLGPEAISQLLRSRGLAVDAARVHEGSGGNPLFALEMGRALAAGRPVESGTLAEILELRISALDAAALALLEWAATLGHVFTLDLIAAAAQRPAHELLEATATLERHGLLHAHADGAGYEFVHDLIREAAFRRVPSARRRVLHAALARALSESSSGGEALAAEVAHHALLGGDQALAVRASIPAGRRALRLFALREARAMAERALPLVPALPHGERLRAELALVETIVLSKPGVVEMERAVARLAEIVLEAESTSQADVVSQALHIYSWGNYFRENESDSYGDSMRSAEAARLIADPLDRARGLAQAGRCLAQIERDLDRGLELLDEAEAIAGKAAATLVDLDYGRGLAYLHLGRTDEGRAALLRAVALTRGAGDHWRHAESLFALCRSALSTSEREAALRYAEEVVPVAERLNSGPEPAQARALLALARLLGDPRDASASALFEKSCLQLEEEEAFWRLSLLLILRAELEAGAGRLEEAEQFGLRAQALHKGKAIQLRAGRCLLVLAEIALARGQRDLARTRLAAALAAPGAQSQDQRIRAAAVAAQAVESTRAHTRPSTLRR